MAKKTKIWMPIYIGDYLADTMHLSAEEHGAYILLIMHYWREGGAIDFDKKMIQNICKISGKKCEKIIDFFEVKGDKLFHKRIDEELAVAMEKKAESKARTAAATAARQAKRESKKQNDDSRNVPKTKNVTSNVTLNVKDNVTMSPSPSPSPSSSEDLFKDANASSSERADYQFFMDSWNNAMEGVLPSVGKLNDSRKKTIRLRFQNELNSEKGEWLAYLARVKASDFLCGRTDTEFQASFDWVLKPSNMLKIMEGNYDNRDRVGKGTGEFTRMAKVWAEASGVDIGG